MSTFKLGQRVRIPEGNFEVIGAGKKNRVVLRKIRTKSIRKSTLLKFYPKEFLIVGAILEIVPGKMMELCKDRGTGWWELSSPTNIIVLEFDELTRKIVEKNASLKAAEDCRKVSCHGNPSGIGQGFKGGKRSAI